MQGFLFHSVTGKQERNVKIINEYHYNKEFFHDIAETYGYGLLCGVGLELHKLF